MLCAASLAVSAQTNSLNLANIARYSEANKAVKALPADSQRVVLMGNSITDHWPVRHPEFFEEHSSIIGRGISGQTTTQFLLRFRSDVLELKPAIVVINGAINDIALNTGPYDEDFTFGNIVSMVELAQANGITIVLASCLPAAGFSWRPDLPDPMPVIRSLNARIKAYAEANSLDYLDYFTPMLTPAGSGLNPAYATDTPAVHPNRDGYLVMESVLMPVIDRLLTQPSK